MLVDPVQDVARKEGRRDERPRAEGRIEHGPQRRRVQGQMVQEIAESQDSHDRRRRPGSGGCGSAGRRPRGRPPRWPRRRLWHSLGSRAAPRAKRTTARASRSVIRRSASSGQRRKTRTARPRYATPISRLHRASPFWCSVHQHGGQEVQNDAAVGQHEHGVLRLRADPPDQRVHQRHEQVDEEKHGQPEQGDAELRRPCRVQGRPIEPLPPAGVQHVRPEKGNDADGAPLAPVRTQHGAGA